MKLETKCMDCVHMLRIGDTVKGVNQTLKILHELQNIMSEVLLSDKKQNDEYGNINKEEVLRQLKCLILYIEKKDAVNLADVLEYEILNTIKMYSQYNQMSKN